MLRRIVIGCARAHGLTATFMAKPFLEYAGNGMHVHASMLDADGSQHLRRRQGGRKVLEAAVAGLLTTMPESLLLFINTWNGFRRITPGSYAPTRAVWAENNRSVALRIPVSNDDNQPRRAPHRRRRRQSLSRHGRDHPGHGRRHRGRAVPPPPVEGNAYDDDGLFLPDDMDDALQLMDKSSFADRALGPFLAKVYRDLKRAEIVAFWGEITPLERTTYL